MAVIGLGKLVYRVGWLLWWFPVTSGLIAVAGASLYVHLGRPGTVTPAQWAVAGLLLLGVVLLVGVAAAAGWGKTRAVLRSAWRASWRYRTRRRLARTWGRLATVSRANLIEADYAAHASTSWTPGLRRLRWATAHVLVGRVTVVPGQVIDDVTGRCPQLAAAVNAQWCRIQTTGPRTAMVRWLFHDPLATIVDPTPHQLASVESATGVDLSALPVGRCEDGTPWTLRLLGSHVLVAGVTGSGKGSVFWSTLHALAPAIAAGLVQVWAVDGKAGMELTPGRWLFTRFATTVDEGVTLLEDAADLMTSRATRLAAAGVRAHTPTLADPLVLVLVDEVALFTAYLPDRTLRTRAEKVLGRLATQGRAPGVVVMVALQDPRKDVFNVRNLFPTRIALRLDEAEHVDMVLGDGAHDRGAACETIPDSTPGVGYVKVDGIREPVRVRAAWLDDQAITTLAHQYPAPVNRLHLVPDLAADVAPDLAPDLPTAGSEGDAGNVPDVDVA